MPLALSLSLLVVVILLLGLRFAVPALPPSQLARPLSPVNAILAAVGVLGLVGHCGAMFYPGLLGLIPGIDGYMRTVNALGPASVVLYTVPAVLIVIGLRHQHPAAVITLAFALLAVDVTMYDGRPVGEHLTAISIAVVILAVFVGLLIARIGRPVQPRMSTQ